MLQSYIFQEEFLKFQEEYGENAFEVEVFAGEESLGSGEGRSKKIAEKNAARIGWKKVFDKGVPS